MTVVIYGIAEGGPSGVDGVGIGGAPLEAVSDGHLTAVVSEQVESDRGPGEEELWDYERVIEALMDRHPIVPARYGSRLPDRTDVCSMLSRRRDELTAALERVSGHVELSVDARIRTGAVAAPPQGGREYMLARLSQHRRTEELGRKLQPLSSRARAVRMHALRPPAVGVHAAYLVREGGVEEFAARVSELAGALDEVDVVCTGPWPPYTFAEVVR